ncbi:TetR/AcrR family transcriptional regulator [Actinomadura graeca]|uniref:TetR/AcrR family transcriptional regulator n=1 Tax=Actinomadura graeca TaxID=2750812 RepID=A0ABX8QWN1_9ACTN|nr:TetR/AcrR family transcriptional regulator [Actinomadura graeca]QXJ22389.1 TetR/AcrR family transcriptional regulator [Actinomadura graeca]
MASAERGPRERMVFSAAQLIRRDGVAATGLRDVAAHADAPRGSLRHYFPGGKEQLVNEAVEWAGRYAAGRVTRFVSAMARPTPARLFEAMVRQWTDEFSSAGFARGCPVAAATADCADSVESTRATAAAAFAAWRSPIARELIVMGVPSRKAGAVATLMIGALEGAILMARAERSVRPLQATARELGPHLDSYVVRGADGPPRR